MNPEGSMGQALISATAWVCAAIAPPFKAVRNKSPPSGENDQTDLAPDCSRT
jgi:hypothetical protein